MKMKEQEIREQLKALQLRVATLSCKRLMQNLDLGDRFLLVDLLRDLNRRVEYLHYLEKSKCSVVLEACDIHYNKP